MRLSQMSELELHDEFDRVYQILCGCQDRFHPADHSNQPGIERFNGWDHAGVDYLKLIEQAMQKLQSGKSP